MIKPFRHCEIYLIKSILIHEYQQGSTRVNKNQHESNRVNTSQHEPKRNLDRKKWNKFRWTKSKRNLLIVFLEKYVESSIYQWFKSFYPIFFQFTIYKGI